MIIIFDSGIGGFDCAKKLLEADIAQTNFNKQTKQILYYADVENFPYGNKTKEELEKIISLTFSKLAKHEPEVIIVACNTASAIIKNLSAKQKNGFVENTYNGIPILDTLSALNQIMENEKNLTILATQSTYDYLIEQNVPHNVIALPELAYMIEFSTYFKTNVSETDYIEQKNQIMTYLASNIKHNPEKLLYACTHYPLIHHIFDKMFCAKHFNPIDLIVKEILTSENSYTITFYHPLIEEKFKIYTNFNLVNNL